MHKRTTTQEDVTVKKVQEDVTVRGAATVALLVTMALVTVGGRRMA